jgi:galactokinase/mevalonate kinase-like predicted kinase
MKEISKPWDYLILTASNPEQAAAYRNQLDIRRELGFLSGIEKILVVPDPDGKRVGSAGSTILCLTQVLSLELGDRVPKENPKPQELWKDILERLRILIIHAGGDSKRLPAYAPCGKAFIPLPGKLESVLGSTIFDRQLPVYLDLPEIAPGRGQVVVTTGDVLLDFETSEVRLSTNGVTGLGCKAPPELTQKHGVFVPDKDGTVKLFHQKPSVKVQEETGAINEEGKALLDIGILNWDVSSTVKLLGLAGVQWDDKDGLHWSGPLADAIESRGLDLYREVCCAMGSDVDLNQYLARMEKSGSPIEESCLNHIYTFMSDTLFSVYTLSRCDFLHFGTIHQVMKSGMDLWKKDRGTEPEDSVLSVNTIVSEEGCIRGHSAWIEGCVMESSVELGGENALVGIDICEPLVIPEKACIDVMKAVLPIDDSMYFVRIYGIHDRIKDSVDSGSKFCNLPFEEWMNGMGASDEDLWDKRLSLEDRSIWNARVFPAVKSPRDFRAWLWMFEPQKATETQKKEWCSRKKYSFEDMARQVDQDEFYKRRLAHRSRSFLNTIDKLFIFGSEFSAGELSYLFGQLNEDECADLCVSILKMAYDPEAVASEKSGMSRLKLSRVLHTLASSINTSDKLYGVPWKKILGKVSNRLNEEEKSWLKSRGMDLDSKTTISKLTRSLKDLAFLNLSQAIVTARKSEDRYPRNTLRRDEIIWGRAPARLDLGGGWTDTPPYALENGGRVINAAVNLNGQPPIHVYARLIDAPEIRITSIDHGVRMCVTELDELLDYKQPTSEFALAKAALALSGLSPDRDHWPENVRTLQDILHHFGGGIELTTLAAIPSGSGLGTSSIMGAVLLSVIHRMMGRELSRRELFHSVLQLEQELTTGGGWQDQIGGTIKGVKLITSGPGMVPDPEIRPVLPDLCDPAINGGQTLLYYTGMRRLAKNILRNVVGNYLDRDRRALATLNKLHRLPTWIEDMLSGKDIKGFGESIDLAWRLNKEIDPDSSTPEIEEILTAFEPFMYGAKLLGAGGGGFLLVICRSPEDASKARKRLEKKPPNSLARFFEYDISHTGLEVTVC